MQLKWLIVRRADKVHAGVCAAIASGLPEMSRTQSVKRGRDHAGQTAAITTETVAAVVERHRIFLCTGEIRAGHHAAQLSRRQRAAQVAGGVGEYRIRRWCHGR
jgi:hypothetical protein